MECRYVKGGEPDCIHNVRCELNGGCDYLKGPTPRPRSLTMPIHYQLHGGRLDGLEFDLPFHASEIKVETGDYDRPLVYEGPPLDLVETHVHLYNDDHLADDDEGEELDLTTDGPDPGA
jgi:hypothetical protein